MSASNNWRELLGTQVHGHNRYDSEAQRRDAELVMLFTGGLTMTEIGKAIGISRERVRQRLKRMGYVGRTYRSGWKSIEPWVAAHRKREAKLAAKAARFQEDAQKLRVLAVELGRVPTLREAAEALGAPVGVWKGTAPAAWLALRGGRNTTKKEPYRPFVAALYAAAGLRVRPRGALGNIVARQPKTHCQRGHAFTPENTYTWGTTRHCRTCRRERERQRYRRKKQRASCADTGNP